MNQPFAFDAYVIDHQETQEEATAWAEYRAHGGKLDLVQYMEQVEMGNPVNPPMERGQ